ncbi:MAG: protein-disulfide reductase DsbD N-terminal domain-containing protein [Planctomycetes bacterium]|nr:protein-disulfide reductase DsbD N-terminal domain-containing protein [Planctomycetota bacterium]
MHVKEAERRLGSQIPWICDTMTNDIKHALGDAPNSEFVVDPEGRIAVRRQWSDPEQLRKDLEELLGPVEKPTTVSDLDLKTIPPPRAAPSGVVEGVRRPRGLSALVIEPIASDDKQPFYVKLRAEADRDVLRGGTGKLYLGFHLDPLYHVHWNNLTKPIRVEIAAPDGTTVEPATLEGPQVEAEADIDPREFLVDVNGADRERPLKLTVRYFACNDDAGWCKAVTQEYVVRFEVDRDGGWARGSRPAQRAEGRPPAARTPQTEGRRSPEMGRVVSIDVKQQRLTILTRDGKEREFRLAENARLMRDRRPAALVDFEPGERCMFRYEAAKNEQEPPVIVGLMVRGDR